jgi:hypothetical protein
MTGTSVTMKVYSMDTIIELEGECININMYIRQGLGHTITTRL